MVGPLRLADSAAITAFIDTIARQVIDKMREDMPAKLLESPLEIQSKS